MRGALGTSLRVRAGIHVVSCPLPGNCMVAEKRNEKAVGNDDLLECREPTAVFGGCDFTV